MPSAVPSAEEAIFTSTPAASSAAFGSRSSSSRKPRKAITKTARLPARELTGTRLASRETLTTTPSTRRVRSGTQEPLMTDETPRAASAGVTGQTGTTLVERATASLAHTIVTHPKFVLVAATLLTL